MNLLYAAIPNHLATAYKSLYMEIEGLIAVGKWKLFLYILSSSFIFLINSSAKSTKYSAFSAE